MKTRTLLLILAGLTVNSSQLLAQQPVAPANAPTAETIDIEMKINDLVKQLGDPALTPEKRKELENQVQSLKQAMGAGAKDAAPAMRGPTDMKTEAGLKSSSTGVPAPVHPADAPLKFETTLHDWGKISDESPVTYSFKFKNTGNKQINITGVKASCGCTGSAASKLNLNPGDESTIDVKFDPTGRNGPEAKTITVTTDDEKVKDYQLLACSVVLKTVVVEPTAIYFQQHPLKKSVSQEFTVTSRVDGFTIKNVTMSGANAANLKLEELGKDNVDLDGGKATRYRYRLTTDGTIPVGTFSAIANLDTNLTNPKFAKSSVSINGEVIGGLMLNPSVPVVYVRMAVPGEPIVGETQLVSRTGKPFKILSAEVVGANAALNPVIDIRPREKNSREAQRIIFNGTAPTNAQEITGTLVVTTDVEDMPEIRFKLQGWQQQVAQPTPAPAPAPAPQKPAAQAPVAPAGAAAATTPAK